MNSMLLPTSLRGFPPPPTTNLPIPPLIIFVFYPPLRQKKMLWPCKFTASTRNNKHKRRPSVNPERKSCITRTPKASSSNLAAAPSPWLPFTAQSSLATHLPHHRVIFLDSHPLSMPSAKLLSSLSAQRDASPSSPFTHRLLKEICPRGNNKVIIHFLISW